MLSNFPANQATPEQFDHFLGMVFKQTSAEEAGGPAPPIKYPNSWIDKALFIAGCVTTPVFALTVSAIGVSSPAEFLQPVTDLLSKTFNENQRDALVLSTTALFAASVLSLVARQNYIGRHTEYGPPFAAQNIDLEIYDFCINNELGEVYKYKDTPERWNQQHSKGFSHY